VVGRHPYTIETQQVLIQDNTRLSMMRIHTIGPSLTQRVAGGHEEGGRRPAEPTIPSEEASFDLELCPVCPLLY
jgi:hypothetical protein